MFLGNDILLIGCGTMGSAMLNAWSHADIGLQDIKVIEPSLKKGKKRELLEKVGIQIFSNFKELPENYTPDIIFFTVNIEDIEKILPGYIPGQWPDSVFVSFSAGKSLNFFENFLGAQAAIIRATPNLPALVGNSVTVVVPNQNTTNMHKHACDTLFQAVGFVHWIDDENLMAPVAAISGSGPAYVFYFMECLANTALEMGMDEEMAKLLAYETVIGTARLALATADSPGTWRKRMTTKGGTTEAGLNILMDKGSDGMQDLITKAVKAATERFSEKNAEEEVAE